MDTLLWLRKLYRKELPLGNQVLPYELHSVNFWRHLIACEKTIEGMRDVRSRVLPAGGVMLTRVRCAAVVVRSAAGRVRFHQPRGSAQDAGWPAERDLPVPVGSSFLTPLAHA